MPVKAVFHITEKTWVGLNADQPIYFYKVSNYKLSNFVGNVLVKF